MHTKHYPAEFVIEKVWDYDCMHSGLHIKEVVTVTNPAVVFIPLVKDTIMAF